jgi:DNA-binding PadR family transcriptional regulator
MSELRLLAQVARYPDRVALARRGDSESFFPLLGRLERDGLVTSRGEAIHLTGRGKSELALRRSLCLALARALA